MTEIESVKNDWTKGCCPEPFRTSDDLLNEKRSSVMAGLSTLAGYFGEEKAMYFAFVSFYSLYCGVFLVPVGVIVSAIQFYNIATEGFSKDTVHNIYIPLFSVFISLWATVTVEFWKRKQAELAFRWDTADVVNEEKFRPEYWGPEKFDPVTLTVMKDFSKRSRALRRCGGNLVVTAMVGIVVAIFLVVRWFKRDFLPSENSEFETYLNALAGVLQGVLIAVLNLIYKYVASWLTVIENHPTQTAHDNALIYKVFFFQFINGNMALMSAAFLDKEPVTLWSLLITLMVGNQFIKMAQNQLGPRIQFWWAQLQTNKATLRRRLLELAESAKEQSSKIVPVKNTFWEVDSKRTDTTGEKGDTSVQVPRKKKRRMSVFNKPKELLTEEEKKTSALLDATNAKVLDEDDPQESDFPTQEMALTEAMRNCSMTDDDLLVDNYADIMLQFTYVVLWSSVFPLTPLVAVLLNFVQIRFEITQSCYYTKRYDHYCTTHDDGRICCCVLNFGKCLILFFFHKLYFFSFFFFFFLQDPRPTKKRELVPG